MLGTLAAVAAGIVAAVVFGAAWWDIEVRGRRGSQ